MNCPAPWEGHLSSSIGFLSRGAYSTNSQQTEEAHDAEAGHSAAQGGFPRAPKKMVLNPQKGFPPMGPGNRLARRTRARRPLSKLHDCKNRVNRASILIHSMVPISTRVIFATGVALANWKFVTFLALPEGPTEP